MQEKHHQAKCETNSEKKSLGMMGVRMDGKGNKVEPYVETKTRTENAECIEGKRNDTIKELLGRKQWTTWPSVSQIEAILPN